MSSGSSLSPRLLTDYISFKNSFKRIIFDVASSLDLPNKYHLKTSALRLLDLVLIRFTYNISKTIGKTFITITDIKENLKSLFPLYTRDISNLIETVSTDPRKYINKSKSIRVEKIIDLYRKMSDNTLLKIEMLIPRDTCACLTSIYIFLISELLSNVICCTTITKIAASDIMEATKKYPDVYKYYSPTFSDYNTIMDKYYIEENECMIKFFSYTLV